MTILFSFYVYPCAAGRGSLYVHVLPRFFFTVIFPSLHSVIFDLRVPKELPPFNSEYGLLHTYISIDTDVYIIAALSALSSNVFSFLSTLFLNSFIFFRHSTCTLGSGPDDNLSHLNFIAGLCRWVMKGFKYSPFILFRTYCTIELQLFWQWYLLHCE